MTTKNEPTESITRFAKPTANRPITKNETKHTPKRTWTVGCKGNPVVRDEHGLLIATFILPDDALDCVRAVNSHNEMLEALKPFAGLEVVGCDKCAGSGNHGYTDMACTKCGGFGELVIGFPSPQDVKAATKAIANATKGE